MKDGEKSYHGELSGGRVVGFSQEVRLRLREQELIAMFQTQPPGGVVPKLRTGEWVVVGKFNAESTEYVIVEGYRLPAIWVLLAVASAVIVLVGRWRGLAALIALLISIAIIIFGVALNILIGRDPMITALVGCGVVIINALLAHGFTKQTLLAAAATLGALMAGALLALLVLPFAHLYGTANSTALFL